jgi:probable H4MPT-linked C1 transfer pathway protein
MTARFLGLDIGGANLKISDGEAAARSVAFPLWKSPELLAGRLWELMDEFPPSDGLAVTMTGELADCFQTKAEGVDFILTSIEEAAAGRPIAVWQTGAEFVPPDVAREISLLVAAANWHALATWLGRMVPEGFSLLIDMGSTTTDIIPIWNGVPIPTGFTDRERLASGELVYTGLRRTPLCAVSREVPFRGKPCPVAAELFATTLDACLVLGMLKEDPTDLDTANGRPATQAAAHDRLARMICCDKTEVAWSDALEIARHFVSEQRGQITLAFRQVLATHAEPLSQVLVSGSGSLVIEQVLNELPLPVSCKRCSLDQLFQPEIAESACAFAVARLAAERVPLG